MPRRPSRRMLTATLILLAAGAVVVGYGVLPVARALRVATPPRKALDRAPRDLGLAAAEDVSFSTTAGEAIRGWFVPGSHGAAVVLTHGYGSNKADELEPARWLHEAGYGVLLVDLAGHGASGGDRLAVDGRDVLAAVDYLAGRGDVQPGRIGLWGFSLGGLASLQAAAQRPEVGAVVADGPFPVVAAEDMPAPGSVSEWLWLPFDVVQRLALRLRGVAPAMSTVAALRRIGPRPVLLVAGTRNAGERRVLRHYAAAAGASATLWEVPEAGHTEALGLRREAYVQRVLDLFDQALLGADAGEGPVDGAAVRRKVLAAMAAVTTWEQRLTDSAVMDGSQNVTEYWYRHELPDRHAIRTAARSLRPDGSPGSWPGGEIVRVGRRYWTRDSDQPAWVCTEEFDLDETQPVAFVPGPDAVYLGLDESVFGTWYRFADPTPTPDDAGQVDDRALGSAYWVDAATFRVTRIDGQYVRGNEPHLESRQLSAFNSPPRIEPPGPCHTPTPEPADAVGGEAP